MKRYLVFAGSRYYPDGGWSDFKASFDTTDEAWKFAKEFCQESEYHWSHFVDTETSSITVCVTCWGEE